MERKTFSLTQKGQILIEGLLFICFLIGFFLTLNVLQDTVQKEVNKHRFYKKEGRNHVYKKRVF